MYSLVFVIKKPFSISVLFMRPLPFGSWARIISTGKAFAALLPAGALTG
jgi:hypothetical protein